MKNIFISMGPNYFDFRRQLRPFRLQFRPHCMKDMDEIVNFLLSVYESSNFWGYRGD